MQADLNLPILYMFEGTLSLEAAHFEVNSFTHDYFCFKSLLLVRCDISLHFGSFFLVYCFPVTIESCKLVDQSSLFFQNVFFPAQWPINMMKFETNNSNIQGPVVQSVLSLRSSLRVISLTVLADSIYNSKSYSHFFSKKFQHICVSLDVNFNESLTNHVFSFEQLGPDFLSFLSVSLVDFIINPAA